MMIRPVDILHALGRITTPPITELIDLSSTWAEIRYLWAFVPNFDSNRLRSLRLNPPVKALDFHQKTLLSDEFGVGFAAYFMSVCVRASDPVDVFLAKRGGQVRLRGNSRRSLPDYIFSGPQPGQFFILECKGTQSSRATAVNQLQRGTEQVLTVDIAGAQNVTRLVIAAWLQQAITLLIVDPEEEGDGSVEVPKLSSWEPEEVSVCRRKAPYLYRRPRCRVGTGPGARGAVARIPVRRAPAYPPQNSLRGVSWFPMAGANA